MILSYSWFRVITIYLVKTTTQVLFSVNWWKKSNIVKFYSLFCKEVK